MQKEKNNELMTSFDTFYKQFVHKFQSTSDLNDEKQRQTISLLDKINQSQNGFQFFAN